MDDTAAGEVVAMQFAGGMSVDRLIYEWERDREWIEAAIRAALLRSIPIRSGGLKLSRSQVRTERTLLAGPKQPELF